MSHGKQGNPAVVGLAGFGLTTLMLQFHNLGLCGVGPVLWLGLFFGGAAQLIAGYQEKSTGNNFGYCAFTAYGAFWICLAGIFIGGEYNFFKLTAIDMGFFLLGWTLFTVILWIASFRIHTAMAFTFSTLLIGFIFLVLSKFVNPAFHTAAAIDLIFCAFGAWYMMAGTILADLAGRPVLPMGKPWIS